jgi:hypothetical protein
MAAVAIATVAKLMPLGDPTPVEKGEKPTEAQRQHARRYRFMTSKSGGAIATKLKALMAAPDSPGRLDLADLDTDPDVLWAGGWPYDLRNSGQQPTGPVLRGARPGTHLIDAKSRRCGHKADTIPADLKAEMSAIRGELIRQEWEQREALKAIGIRLIRDRIRAEQCDEARELLRQFGRTWL